ncbi:unnamed protein product, partial [Effrenium voratum]
MLPIRPLLRGFSSVFELNQTLELGLEPRFVNHSTIDAFYELYLLWAEGAALPEGEIASCRTFRNVYEEQWKETLKMRTVSQHARFRSITHIYGEDFVRILREEFKPIRGRLLKVELLEGALNFKEYLNQLTVEIGGLVTTHWETADANHCWRFIRRSDLPLYDDKTQESWAPVEIPGENYTHSPEDCVLLVKHLVNSESLSQHPLILLPAAFGEYLKKPLTTLPRNLIADRAKKEFLRTACAVEKEPWDLHRAAAALR